MAVTVHTQYQSTFRDVTRCSGDAFQLDPPLVSELVKAMEKKYGPKLGEMLIDPHTRELNAIGTLFVDSKGRRISLHDTLGEGEVISFLVGIAAG